MNLVILLLALTVTTGLSWAVSDLVDRSSRWASGRRREPRRHQPW